MDKRIAVIGGGVGRKNPLGPIDEVRTAGFAATLFAPRLKVFPHTPLERGLSMLAYLDAGIEAEKAGYDAVFINTCGDYGIDEMRSALGIPVTGAGEATYAMASTIGKRFAIVKIWPPRMNFITEGVLRASGTDARCVSIRNVLRDDEVVSTSTAVAQIDAMQNHSRSIIERTMEQIKRAVDEDGADSVVLGCTCMAAIGPELIDRSPVPVLEPMRAGYKVAEASLSLGIRQTSRVTYPRANPALLAALDDMISHMHNRELSASCDMCVVAEAAE